MNELISPIATIKAMRGEPGYKPAYDVSQGPTAWRFSDYCRRHGYQKAEWMVLIIKERTEGIPADCQLLTTYRAFKAAEANEHAQ